MNRAPAAAQLPAFYHRIALGAVDSTNDEALARAAEGAAEGTLITAQSQRAGRGRRGRRWESVKGNLFLSVILRPEGGMDAAAAVGFAGALAAFDAIAALLPPGADVALKWPNDVLVRGRKVSGLLIEHIAAAAAPALVLGVGINLVSHPAGTPYPATDLGAEGAGAVPVAAALTGFCRAFLARYRAWQRDGFAALRADWLTRARGIGAPLAVEIEGRRFDGIFQGIDGSGALCLDLGRQGVKKVTAGDVFFPSPAGEEPC